ADDDLVGLHRDGVLGTDVEHGGRAGCRGGVLLLGSTAARARCCQRREHHHSEHPHAAVPRHWCHRLSHCRTLPCVPAPPAAPVGAPAVPAPPAALPACPACVPPPAAEALPDAAALAVAAPSG